MEGVVMNPDFWKNKTVLITGNTGFKGSWLSLWLSSMGAKVIGYALPAPTTPSLYELAEIANDITMIEGDITNLSLIKETLGRYEPEILIHMAAQSLVRPSYQNPVETYKTNIMGTVNVLEAMRNIPSVRSAIIVTSDKCYENKETEAPYNEEDPMGGFDPYSSSKGCSELVVSAYRRSFFPKNEYHRHGVALASVRAGNVIGGGDWSNDRLLVDAMKAFISGEKLIIRNPKAVRPWQHVLDPLTGYLTLAEKLWDHGSDYSEAWNFGPDLEDSRTVAWVVDKLCRFWSNGSSWEKDQNQSPHEAGLLFLDSSKARQRLGWQPKLKIMSSLTWTVAWYMAFQRGADMKTLCLRQIAQYEELPENAFSNSSPENDVFKTTRDNCSSKSSPVITL